MNDFRDQNADYVRDFCLVSAPPSPSPLALTSLSLPSAPSTLVLQLRLRLLLLLVLLRHLFSLHDHCSCCALVLQPLLNCDYYYYYYNHYQANQLFQQRVIDLLKENLDKIGADAAGTIVYMQYVSCTVAAAIARRRRCCRCCCRCRRYSRCCSRCRCRSPLLPESPPTPRP